MQHPEVWKHVEEVLQKKQFLSQFYEEDESSAAFLLIDIGKDSKNRDRFVKLSITEQEMGQGLGIAGENAENPVFGFDYQFEIPLEYKTSSAKEVASLINFINRQISFAKFELDEMRDAIYLSSSHFMTLKGIDDRLIAGYTGLMLMYADIYIALIEEVSCGKMLFNEVIEQMIELNTEYLKST